MVHHTRIVYTLILHCLKQYIDMQISSLVYKNDAASIYITPFLYMIHDLIPISLLHGLASYPVLFCSHMPFVLYIVTKKTRQCEFLEQKTNLTRGVLQRIFRFKHYVVYTVCGRMNTPMKLYTVIQPYWSLHCELCLQRIILLRLVKTITMHNRKYSVLPKYTWITIINTMSHDILLWK